jgi:hypothetical protein
LGETASATTTGSGQAGKRRLIAPDAVYFLVVVHRSIRRPLYPEHALDDWGAGRSPSLELRRDGIDHLRRVSPVAISVRTCVRQDHVYRSRRKTKSKETP